MPSMYELIIQNEHVMQWARGYFANAVSEESLPLSGARNLCCTGIDYFARVVSTMDGMAGRPSGRLECQCHLLVSLTFMFQDRIASVCIQPGFGIHKILQKTLSRRMRQYRSAFSAMAFVTSSRFEGPAAEQTRTLLLARLLANKRRHPRAQSRLWRGARWSTPPASRPAQQIGPAGKRTPPAFPEWGRAGRGCFLPMAARLPPARRAAPAPGWARQPRPPVPCRGGGGHRAGRVEEQAAVLNFDNPSPVSH